MKKIALVYCGSNPLCTIVEQEFSGLIQKSLSISPEDPMLEDWKVKEAFMDNIAEEYDLILTDNTLSTTEGNKSKQINLYRILKEPSFEEWLEDVQAVITHYRNQGKKLTINAYGLADHMWMVVPQEERDRFAWISLQLESRVDSALLPKIKTKAEEQGNAVLTREEAKKKRHRENAYFAYLLGEVTSIPIIPYDSLFRFTQVGTPGILGNVQVALQEIGLDPENTVVFIDHHAATYPSKEHLVWSGFDQLPLYPIDPCCIGRRYCVDTHNSKCKIEPAVVHDRYTQQIFEELRHKIST